MFVFMCWSFKTLGSVRLMFSKRNTGKKSQIRIQVSKIIRKYA